MYLLDTDYMSLIQRGNADGKTIVQRLITTNSPLATTVITYKEQMRGWLDLIARATKFDAQVRGYQLLHQHALNYQKSSLRPLTFLRSQPTKNFAKPIPDWAKWISKLPRSPSPNKQCY